MKVIQWANRAFTFRRLPRACLNRPLSQERANPRTNVFKRRQQWIEAADGCSGLPICPSAICATACCGESQGSSTGSYLHRLQPYFVARNRKHRSCNCRGIGELPISGRVVSRKPRINLVSGCRVSREVSRLVHSKVFGSHARPDLHGRPIVTQVHDRDP